MIDDTNAANVGCAQPTSFDSSVWMKTNPVNGWFSRTTGPCMCAPQPLYAWRTISALEMIDLQLVRVFRHLDFVARRDRDLREQRPARASSTARTADVVVLRLAGDDDLYRIAGAQAAQRPPAKSWVPA